MHLFIYIVLYINFFLLRLGLASWRD